MAEKDEQQQSPLHILFFPFLAPGHLIPIADMAALFASRGVRCTILTTPVNAAIIRSAVDRANDAFRGIDCPAIDIAVVPFPDVGLPPGVENGMALTSPDDRVKFFQAVTQLREPFDRFLADNRPDAVVSDSFFHWSADAAAEHGVPRLGFLGSSMFARACSDSMLRNNPLESAPNDPDALVSLSGLPHRVELRRSQMMDPVKRPDHWALLKSVDAADQKSYGEVFNSFHELEPDYVEHYQRAGRRVWLVGPVGLASKDMAGRGASTLLPDADSCMRWLDTKQPGSVVYVSFGTLTSFSPAELHELARGLDLSGKNFVWVLGRSGPESSEWMPEGFADLMARGDRGFIIRGWAPQMLILNHRALGGFVTHCGWNSTLEAVSAGVPMVTWPRFADQFNNEKLIVEVLKVGVSIGAKDFGSGIETHETIGGEVLAEAIGRLMGSSEESDAIQKKAKDFGVEARSAVEDGGSSYNDVGSLIDELMARGSCLKGLKCKTTEGIGNPQFLLRRPIAPIPRAPASTSAAAGDESDDDVEYEVSDDHRAARERHERAVQDLLQRRRAYAMAVPTNGSAARARLRRLGEPITLFVEKEMERRDRLRALMVRLEADGHFDRLLRAQEDDQGGAGADDDDDAEQIQYPFFTEGTQELLQARVDIALYSLPRAKARVERAKRRLADPDDDPEAEADLVVKQAGEFVLECSEIGDDRPLTGCSFSRDASMLATSSWSGIIKVWSMPQITKIATLKGHTERATDVAFSPVDNVLATASADKTAKLWNSDGSLLMSFNGHLDRLARLAFHPSGKYLGTASFDKTWRLWDINTGTELLLQEGHSRSVYGVSFHPDGSLAASCGLDAHARVWDLRSGRLYCTLIGHVKPVLGVSFSPNGHLVATASEDNFCRIWDLRTRRMLYSIPAHKSLISHVKFEPQEGYYLATSSYDTKIALWSTRDYKPIKSLAGHESKVTSLDISGDGQQIVTVSHDRTIKMWSCRSSTRDNEMELD